MKAAVLREIGKPFTIESIALADPGPHEVRIRTAATGICHSDWHFATGAYPQPVPTILGHESAGVVVAVGAHVRTVAVGDHVVTCLSAYCGHCEPCLTGHLSLCASDAVQRAEGDPPRIADSGGAPLAQFLNLSGFAEEMLVHEHACVAIRRDMPLDRAALLGCAVLTGYGAVVHSAGVRPGDSVAVIGCGGVGLSAIAAAALAGAGRIIAIDTAADKEPLARQFGATDFLLSAGDPLDKIVRSLTGGGVAWSFEAVGRTATAEAAFAMLRPGGTATIIGMIPVGETLTLKGSSFMMERKIQGSQMGSNRFPVDIPRLVDFYMAGRLPLDALISQRLRLEQINDGFAALHHGSVARSVIVFD